MAKIKKIIFDLLVWLCLKPRPRQQQTTATDIFDAAAQGTDIYLAGLFETSSGIGNSARLFAQHYLDKELTFKALNLSPDFKQQNTTTDIPLADRRDLPKDKKSILLLFLNAPETTLALWRLRLTGALDDWHIIGYWAWEMTEIPESWVKGAKYVDEIWAPSQFCAEAFTKKVDCPVFTQPFPLPEFPKLDNVRDFVRDKAWYPDEISQDDFVILSCADSRSSLHRKNLLGSIDAFFKFNDIYEAQHQKKPKAKLALKISNKTDGEILNIIHRKMKGRDDIVIIDEIIPQNELVALIQSCDVFLSLHRAEGFGLMISEALLLDVPVVATNYSGGDHHFTHPLHMGVDFKLDQVTDPTGVYPKIPKYAKWAVPDTAHAAELLCLQYKEAQK